MKNGPAVEGRRGGTTYPSWQRDCMTAGKGMGIVEVELRRTDSSGCRKWRSRGRIELLKLDVRRLLSQSQALVDTAHTSQYCHPMSPSRRKQDACKGDLCWLVPRVAADN